MHFDDYLDKCKGYIESKTEEIEVKYEEVGFYNGGYNAVFWIGKKPVDFIKENKIKK